MGNFEPMLQRISLVIILVLMLLVGLPGASFAAEANAGDVKLRENLRSTMLQLRTIQGERDALQAEKVQSDQEKKALNEKVETLIKQSIADKDAADKSIAELKTRTLDHVTEIAQLKDTMEKMKAALKKTTDLANATEAKRAKLAEDVILLKRTVAEREAQNRELFKTGNEILTRYEKFGLGTALSAREPFTGLTRVKLQNLVQDYQDKLLDQKAKP
jgi:chromosome segregation ATPase